MNDGLMESGLEEPTSGPGGSCQFLEGSVAMVEYAPHFGLMTPGDRINLVASVVAFDNMGSNHLMNAVISRNMFSFVGSLPPGS